MRRGPRSVLFLALGLFFLLVTFYEVAKRLTSYRTDDTALSTDPSALSPWRSDLPSPSFAYVQFATNRQYLCNAVINAKRLRLHGTRATIAVLVPEEFIAAEIGSPTYRLMTSLKEVGATIHTAPLISRFDGPTDLTYTHSFMKLQVFNLPYRRIVYFDNDGLIGKNMDELFLLPSADLILPQAWWLPEVMGKKPLCSALMVVEPSKELHQKAQKLQSLALDTEYDMEVINKVADERSRILPHRRHFLLSSLFRTTAGRANYLDTIEQNDPAVKWNATDEFSKAFYIHFSDYPTPKPWKIDQSMEGRAAYSEATEPCKSHGEDDPECISGRIWRGLYGAFQAEMMQSCPSQYEQWPPIVRTASDT